jgi:crotonobetainyl-CoA:carnitine CoA-transferase CaiB-like acyl-CoA transferase
VEHPVAGRVDTIGLPVKFSGTPGGITRPAPLFGQHTRSVLEEAGYAANEIDRLLADGAAIVSDKE